MVEEGLAILDTGIENYPEFVLFSKLLTYADEDVNSPEFQNAFEAVRDNTSACGGEEIGSDDDVIIESNFEDPACSNHFRAAHNVEGSAIFVGDVYLKAATTKPLNGSTPRDSLQSMHPTGFISPFSKNVWTTSRSFVPKRLRVRGKTEWGGSGAHRFNALCAIAHNNLVEIIRLKTALGHFNFTANLSEVLGTNNFSFKKPLKLFKLVTRVSHRVVVGIEPMPQFSTSFG